VLTRQEGFALSPGDLDEAVQLLLSVDYASRNASRVGIASGFERVNVFRSGALRGTPACELP
jgi:hypothetical protein